MNYRKLGKTDLALSEITFGAWAIGGWMWGGASKADAIQAIKASFDVGMTSIDTAPIYGQGRSEEIVGEAIKDIPRDKLQILTKFGMRWDLQKGDHTFSSTDDKGNPIEIYKYAGKESIIKECEDSLRRLGTDYIDLYQIHWPESTTPIDESFEAVEKLIQAGKVRYAGVCNYDVAQCKEADNVVSIASNQIPYSMVNRGIEDEVVPNCIENNIGILAYSPLQRGLLTGKFKPNHDFNSGDHRDGNKFFTNEFITQTNEFLQKIEPIAIEKNASLAQLVLKWTVMQPGITVALAGARNVEQTTQNAKASDLSLTDDEISYINGLLKEF
ncbi:aldo/keto reductase [Paracrocinitomix mangrovi]|uniref:aldo/keto reductase n=1 Tax=Paracrocinitomix mangrovi TaxID=2862509 RepID=UPI001C8E9B13|nr:aldo/keto reductase [Paracrocinitomix mangrovi]UKN03831.1 aldo/keto reductase [Paracrocinitomix mangrovi]